MSAVIFHEHYPLDQSLQLLTVDYVILLCTTMINRISLNTHGVYYFVCLNITGFFFLPVGMYRF